VLGPAIGGLLVDGLAIVEADALGEELALAVGDVAGVFSPPPHPAGTSARGSNVATVTARMEEAVREGDMRKGLIPRADALASAKRAHE
jgi:hypothetical protein